MSLASDWITALPHGWPSAPAPEVEAAFWEAQRTGAQRSWRVLLFGIAVLNLFWWVGDYFVYGDPHLVAAVRPIRIATSGLAFLLYGLLPRLELLRRHPFPVLALAVLSVGSLIAWTFAEFGGPGTLWFSLTFPILIIPTAMPFRPPVRLAVMALFGMSFALAYYGRRPEHFSDPHAWTTLSYLFFVVVVGASGGVVVDYWRRDAFFLRTKTQEQAEQLSEMNHRLEDRVAEQTAELRLLARNVESARETERAHIARELHDELGQELTALRYALKFTQVRYDKEPLAIGANLTNLEKVLGQATVRTRQMVRELRPKVLDDLGLVAAVEWLVSSLRDRSGLDVRLEAPVETLSLDAESNVAAFRMVQEALTNAAKHANAAVVMVSIQIERGSVVVTVRDDGAGFSPESCSNGGGSGLIGMRERLRSAGGELRVESQSGKGTVLTGRLPLSASTQERAG